MLSKVTKKHKINHVNNKEAKKWYKHEKNETLMRKTNKVFIFMLWNKEIVNEMNKIHITEAIITSRRRRQK